MLRLGQAYLACGEQTALVELFLRRVATARGLRHARVVAFPTAVFVSVHDGDREHVALSEGPIQTLRLDQVAEIYRLGEVAQRGELEPAEGLRLVNETLRRAPRFGTPGVVIGHVVLSAGLSIVLAPSWTNVAATAALGLIVGGLKVLNRDRAILAAPLSVIAAAIVSMLVFLAIRYGLPVEPLYVLVPPLVTFLPGAMLTFGMVELAYGDMVSGSSRLITGFVQLVLLAFGLAAGAALVGVGANDLLNASTEILAGPWIPWLGVLVFAVGVYLHFSAPARSFLWVLLVLLVAFGAQRTAGAAFGKEISGFFGTLVATPLGYLIQQRFQGPPSMVTFLPSFWLLVPGSFGLLSVTRMLSDRAAGLDGLVTALFAFASIALGSLVGASLYKLVTDQIGAWQLQVGRATRRP